MESPPLFFLIPIPKFKPRGTVVENFSVGISLQKPVFVKTLADGSILGGRVFGYRGR